MRTPPVPRFLRPLAPAATAVLLLSCAGPIGPDPAPSCAGWSLHYTRHDGWGDTAVLHIDTGSAAALRLAQATGDTVARVQTTLGPGEVASLAHLADPSGWARRYAAAGPLTDGQTHRVVTVCDGRADTVDVDGPRRSRLPDRLALLLEVLQDRWRGLLYPRD